MPGSRAGWVVRLSRGHYASPVSTPPIAAAASYGWQRHPAPKDRRADKSVAIRAALGPIAFCHRDARSLPQQSLEKEADMKIVVIGGTGRVGSKMVERLHQEGHVAIAAAPSTGVNTITGEGLDGALAGADVVIDTSNTPALDDHSAWSFFATAGHNLVSAEIAAGVRHHIVLSIVGADRLQHSGYLRAKLLQEELAANSPIPYSVVRATQFFEYLRDIANFSTVENTVFLPPVQFQPIAADDVAGTLIDVALAPPIGGIIDIAGPDIFTLDAPIRRVLAIDRDPRPIVVDASAPYAGVQLEDASLVPGPGARLGSTTLDWWIANVPAPTRA
jgi:uncharacterized protein YbjT (DUF2867 family)